MATTTTGSELIANVLSNTADATALLVLADWLGEQGWSKDEKRCRTTAAEILKGEGPKTLSDYKGDRSSDSNVKVWRKHTQWLLALAIKAAAPDRVTVTKSQATWTGNGEYLIKLDGVSVDLEVDTLHTSKWSGYLSGKAVCTVSVNYERKKVFPSGKSGFSTHKIVAEVFAQFEAAERKRANQEASNDRYHRLQAACGQIEKEFGKSYENGWRLDNAEWGERLTFSLSRPPEEIRKIMKVLKDAGLLKKEQD